MFVSKVCSENKADSIVTIGDDACKRPEACMYLKGSATIPDHGCRFGKKPCNGTFEYIPSPAPTRLISDGGTCSSERHHECASGRCFCSKCASRSTQKLPNGFTCSEASDCTSGKCCKTVCVWGVCTQSCSILATAGCRGQCKASDDVFSDVVFSPSADANLRGSDDSSTSDFKTSTDSDHNAACLPTAQKVKFHKLRAAESVQAFELQVTSSGVDVAKGKALASSVVAAAVVERTLEHSSVDTEKDTWEVDLQDSFPVDSVSVLNTWCSESTDPEKCLCDFTGATLSLIGGSGEEITSVSVGDTCGQKMVEFIFDASAEFCKPAVSFNVIVSM